MSELPTPPPAPTPASPPVLDEDTFYHGALKRTGTLYSGAKEGFSGGLKRSGTILEGAKEGINGGLRRSGTILEGTREAIVQRSTSISEVASQGLQRTGTLLYGARQAVVERTGTIKMPAVPEDARAGLQRTGTMLQSAGAGALQRVGTMSEWARDYAKGIYDPDRPLKATFQEVAGVALPRTAHSISVIAGRVYIFGGEDETGALADDHMHCVMLPSSGVLEADYKSIAPRAQTKGGPTPSARKGHTAVIIENEIYIFGGELAGKAREEQGRVWVFDTITSKWSFHDPGADAPYPPPRSNHAAAASELPGPLRSAQNTVDFVAQEQDPAKTVPEPPAEDTWGTMFIYGGISPNAEEGQALGDAWAFDIAHRAWLPLPPPPPPARSGASLILSGTKLYRAGGKTDPEHLLTADYLDVGELFQVRERGEAFNRIALPSLLNEWTTMSMTAPLLAPVLAETAAPDGRRLLLSIQPAAKSITAVDISPSGGMMVLAGTSEIEEGDEAKAPNQVLAVQSMYADLYGEVVRGSLTRTFNQVSGYAVGKGTEVEESNLVIWGGKDASGNVLGTGWMVRLS